MGRPKGGKNKEWSKEEKLYYVNLILSGEKTAHKIQREDGISSGMLSIWVKKYNEHGEKGLLKNLKSSYSGEFKQSVIEYMHKNHLSAQETAIHFNLGSVDQATRWERIYYEEGPQVFYEKRRGRNKNMSSKPRKKKLSKENEEDLIEEVQRLRMENAYLKKLQALVQKRTKPKQSKK